MKKFIKIFFLTALSAGLLNSADAQRSNGSRDGEGRGSGGSSRSFSTPSRSITSREAAPSRTFNNAPSRTFNNNGNFSSRNNSMQNVSRGNVVSRAPQINRTDFNSQRAIVSRNDYSRQNVAYRGGYSNNYRYDNNYRYRNYYGNVYGRRTAFMYGTCYRVIPRSFISIHFGGYPYYYNDGYYYGYYNGFYQPLFPPFGLRIGILPFGYSSFYWGGYPYYYYNGIYYQRYGDNDGYEVVDAPMGATVSALPGGATSVVVNGETLYELNGTYYKAGQDSNGNNVFTVVGKNGVINNTQPPVSDLQQPSSQSPLSSQVQKPSSQMQIGDTMSQLPDGAKLVTIDGQQLYQTTDNVYLKGELNNGVVRFRVVGK